VARSAGAVAADVSRALAAAADRAAPRDADLALVLAREAVVAAPTAEALTALHRSLERRRAPGFVAHDGTVTSATFAPDGRTVLTTSRLGDARTWDLAGRQVASFRGAAAGLACGAFAPDGRSVVVGGADRVARVFDVDGALRGALEGAQEDVVQAGFSPDGARVVVVALDGRARVYEPTGAFVAVLDVQGGVDGVRWAPDGGHGVAFGRAGGARRFGRDGSDLGALVPEAGGVLDVRGFPSGDRIFVRTDASVAWVVGADGRTTATLTGHGAAILAIAIAPAGDLLATASLDGTARLWMPDGRSVAVLRGHTSPVFDVAFAADGTRVVTVASDRTARLWDRAGTPVAVLGGATAPVRSARFAPEGVHVVTTGLGVAGVGVVRADGTPVARVAEARGEILEASFAPDGAHLLLVDADRRATVVPLRVADLVDEARRAVPRALSDAERAGALATGAGLASGPPAGSPPAAIGPRRGDEVGAARCATCHREAYDLWRTSAHARTLVLADASALPGGDGADDVAHPPGVTRFHRDGARVVARTAGDDGAPRDFPVTHEVGARRIRMLVTTLDDGRMQVLPAMRELPDGPWFDYTHLIFGAPGLDRATPPTVAPGDPSFWTGPVRSFDARCAGCHASGRTPLAPGPDGTGPRSTWRALGVDCEACHGPGRAHAEAWERLETGAPLPRLDTLDRVGKVQACTQCHLEGERLTPHAVVGDDLFEHVDPTLLLDPERVDPYGRPLELVYGGLPFGVSRCAEEGGLTCARCHAPHGSPRRSLLRRPLDDGAVCATCHEAVARDVGAHAHHAPTGSGGRCLACHMPFLEIERGHGQVADHTLGIPDPTLPGDRLARDACTACHGAGRSVAHGAPALDGPALRAAYRAWWPAAAPHPWQRAVAAARLGEAGADAALVAVLDDPRAYRLVRASVTRLLGRYGEAARAPLLRACGDADGLVRRAASTALGATRGPDVDARMLAALADPSRAVRTAAARAALEGWERMQANPVLLRAALPVLAADAASVPDDDERWFRLGAAYELAGDVAAAVASYDRQVALDPFATNTRDHVRRLRARLAGASGERK